MAEDLDPLVLIEVLELIEPLQMYLLALDDDKEKDGTLKREVMGVDINFWRTLGDPTFHDHFRMTRSVFENLIFHVGKHLEAKERIKFLRTPLDVLSTIINLMDLGYSRQFQVYWKPI